MKIGCIGTGNMGKGVLRAVSWACAEDSFLLSNRTKEKAKAFAKELKNAKVVGNANAAKDSDVLFLAVKPYNLKELAEEIAPVLAKRKTKPLLISMLAGCSAEELQQLLGEDLPVIVMMPNTPVETGEGVVLYYAKDAGAEEKALFERMLAPAGLVKEVPVSQYGPAGSITGCGPALVYMLIESLADSAVAMGVPRKDAAVYAAQMIKGAAAMALESGLHPEQLKDNVCSPGGTTIQMVRKLEEKGFRSAVFEAALAAGQAVPKK